MMICNKEAEIEFTQVQTKLSLRGQGFQVITMCIQYVLSEVDSNIRMFHTMHLFNQFDFR